MKIGFFLPNATFNLPGSPEVGGIETFAFTVGEALQKLGHEVHLFGGKPKLNRSHQSTSIKLHLFDYIETDRIPDIGTRFQRLIQRLHFGWVSRKTFFQENLDCVILAKPFDWPVACYWKKHQPQLKVVMGFHGTDYFAGDRLFWKSVDTSFSVSRSVADLANKRVNSNSLIIPNPVNTDFFNPSAVPHQHRSDSPIKICCSGRLIGWKGFHLLIEAVAILKRKNISVVCHIAGEGSERPKLQHQASQLGLSERIVLEGMLTHDRLRQLLADSDIYCAPSIGHEAFSIASLEAACMGLPLVLSDQVGLGEFLPKEMYASYPHQSPEALAEALMLTLQTKVPFPQQQRLDQHAKLATEFSAEACAKKILHLVDNST